MDAGRSSSSKIGSSGEELALGGARGEKVIKKLVGSGDFNDAGKRSKDRWISKIEIGGSAVIGKGFMNSGLASGVRSGGRVALWSGTSRRLGVAVVDSKKNWTEGNNAV